MTYIPKKPWKMNRPRKTHFKGFDLYTICGEKVYTEDGEVFDLPDFLDVGIHGLPRAVCVVRESPLIVRRLTEHFAHERRFNARLRLMRRTRQSHRDPKRRVTTEHLEAAFFGLYRNADYPKQGYAIRHTLLDPDTFLRLPKHARPYVPNDPASLLDFGRVLREWCRANDLPLATSGIGIASSLLRDRRFLTKATRKVSHYTNERARDALTGHLFYVKSKGATCYPALYRLDQRRSHHRCALELDFPHPDSLYARGYFHSLSDVRWTTPERLEGHNGLLFARVNVRHPSNFHEAMVNAGSHLMMIATNELPYLYAEDGRIEYVIAAWTSPDSHDALNRYARFALDDIDATPTDSLWWKKPLLLAPYGLLGARAGIPHVVADTRPNGNPPSIWHAGRGETLRVFKHPPRDDANRLERPFVNVIARAMIERESRSRTAEKAHLLQGDGWQVVCIDADAILLRFDGDREPPTNCDRWKVTRLDDAIIDGPLLVSDQVVKLPGIPGTYRERFVTNMRRRSTEPTQTKRPRRYSYGVL